MTPEAPHQVTSPACRPAPIASMSARAHALRPVTATACPPPTMPPINHDVAISATLPAAQKTAAANCPRWQTRRDAAARGPANRVRRDQSEASRASGRAQARGRRACFSTRTVSPRLRCLRALHRSTRAYELFSGMICRVPLVRADGRIRTFAMGANRNVFAGCHGEAPATRHAPPPPPPETVSAITAIVGVGAGNPGSGSHWIAGRVSRKRGAQVPPLRCRGAGCSAHAAEHVSRALLGEIDMPRTSCRQMVRSAYADETGVPRGRDARAASWHGPSGHGARLT